MDYQALRTLESVIRNQNFERSAKELLITQSAVSQRLNLIEAHYGHRLLIRELPYRATDFGERLLSHYRKVQSLESSLELESNSDLGQKATIKIAMNVDTIEIWFRKVLQNSALSKLLNLEISVDDEKFTLGYLKSGRVDVSIGTSHAQVSNHECLRLGVMTYVLVCSQEFKRKHAAKGMRHLDLASAPAIIFNDQDDLHSEYLKLNHQYSGYFPKNIIPSLSGTKAALISGYGYGLQPLMDIRKELKQKDLVLLDGNLSYSRELFLHHWNYQTPALRKFVETIILAAKDLA